MSDLFAIEGQHVLVTGASSGFGRHFALFLAGCGARVTVAARRAEAIDKSVQTIQADKGQAQAVVMDVTLTGSVEVALAAAEHPRLDGTPRSAGHQFDWSGPSVTRRFDDRRCSFRFAP